MAIFKGINILHTITEHHIKTNNTEHLH